MARLARIVAVGLPHHIVQRGNRRQTVFFNDADRDAYLSFLKSACEKFKVKILAWCLMNNHIHLVAVPERADSLAKCIGDSHVKYARRINSREGWRGHLWQERFSSSPMDEKHLFAAVRYVERNPVRAGIVNNAWEYKWSSARYHIGDAEKDPLISDSFLKELIGDWGDFLRIEEKDDVERMRRESISGRPIGGDDFVENLEKKFDRRLRKIKAGRPEKKKGS